MANRPYFIADNTNNKFYIEKNCDFQFFTGFAITQKQKSIESLHSEIHKIEKNNNILEVSRKSKNQLGIQLSAFNLIFNNKIANTLKPVENVFQSSKVFENGGPYRDLLNCTPKEAKQDERLKNSGKLIYFELNNEKWDLVPRTMFYDYLYISALMQNKKLSEEITKYDIFTDIEFNPQKSLNCQARSVAIFVSLQRRNLLEGYLNDKELFKSIYTNKIEFVQKKLF